MLATISQMLAALGSHSTLPRVYSFDWNRSKPIPVSCHNQRISKTKRGLRMKNWLGCLNTLWSEEDHPSLELPTTPLLSLAKQGQYHKLTHTLESHTAAELSAWLNDWRISKRGSNELFHLKFTGTTILHLLMPFRPPARVVQLLVSKLSSIRPNVVPEGATDLQGKTPLHWAAWYNCDIATVQELMKGLLTVVPVFTHDAMQRLPLHWACVHPNQHNHNKKNLFSLVVFFRSEFNVKNKMDTHNRMQIINALIRIYPHSVYVPDVHGMTPLDLAIQNQMDPQIIDLLKRSMHMHDTNKNTRKPSSPPCSRTAQESSAVTEKTTTTTTNIITVPMEVTEREEDDEDDEYDEISSIGSGGVSRMYQQQHQYQYPHYNSSRFEPSTATPSHNHHYYPKHPRHNNGRYVSPVYLKI
jgi:hypothetical protein